jgi:hypothetical protein
MTLTPIWTTPRSANVGDAERRSWLRCAITAPSKIFADWSVASSPDHNEPREPYSGTAHRGEAVSGARSSSNR